MQWKISANGRAVPDDVWRRYVEPDQWPGWSPQIRRVDCTDRRLRVGSKGKVHTIVGVSVPFEVTAIDDEERSWSWRVRLPLGFELNLTHTVEPRGSGTRTGLTVTGSALFVIPYLPVAQLALVRLVRP